METLDELENNIRMAEIKLLPIKQIADIRTRTNIRTAWSNLIEIGKKINDNWKLKEPSWQIISNSRK